MHFIFIEFRTIMRFLVFQSELDALDVFQTRVSSKVWMDIGYKYSNFYIIVFSESLLAKTLVT